MPKPRKIKVEYKKLGRDKVWGWCHDTHIEVDERLKGKKHLEILVHESLHFLFPDAGEDEIEQKAIRLTNTLWHEKYRRIDNDNSQKLQDGKK